MKYFSILLLAISLYSCKEDKKEIKEEPKSINGTSDQKTESDSVSLNVTQPAEVKNETLEDDGQDEVMLEKDILFNGKLKRIFELKDFEKVFGKADSTKLMSETQPCTYIFEDTGDGKNDKYLYKNESCFENTEQKVGVNEFWFLNGNYILYKGIKIDGSSTIDDIKKIFPNSVKNISELDSPGRGKVQLIRLREDKENISDGHINIYFKNNRVQSIHWWFPC